MNESIISEIISLKNKIDNEIDVWCPRNWHSAKVKGWVIELVELLNKFEEDYSRCRTSAAENKLSVEESSGHARDAWEIGSRVGEDSEARKEMRPRNLG